MVSFAFPGRPLAPIRSRFCARPFSNTVFVFGPQTSRFTFALGLSEIVVLLLFGSQTR